MKKYEKLPAYWRGLLARSNLAGASVTKEQLAQATSLKGATIPDGSKHP
jgi:hypothetical protein